MKELYEKLEGLLVDHLWDIEREVEDDGGFRCPQQVDDIRDCVSAIRKMRDTLKDLQA